MEVSPDQETVIDETVPHRLATGNAAQPHVVHLPYESKTNVNAKLRMNHLDSSRANKLTEKTP